MPSRFSANAPGRAISARRYAADDDRSGPGELVEPGLGGHRRAIGCGDAHVVVERGGVDADFPGVLRADDHGRGAGVEQERGRHIVDLGGDHELAAQPAADDDFAALADDRLGRVQFRHDAVGEIGKFEAIGVEAGQRDHQRRPGQGAADRARDIGGAEPPGAAEQQPENERGGERRLREMGVVEAEHKRVRRRQIKPERGGGEQNDRQDMAHFSFPPASPACVRAPCANAPRRAAPRARP